VTTQGKQGSIWVSGFRFQVSGGFWNLDFGLTSIVLVLFFVKKVVRYF
jgi:hypothetical protein